jgi:hypothetical protein
MSLTDAVVAMALGAVAYHVYAKVHNLEAAISEGNVVHIGSALDRAGQDGDNEEAGRKFGFSSDNRRS